MLVLNRKLWQATNVRTPQEAFCMMATNVATGLEAAGQERIRPVAWEEWIHLPICAQDQAVHTAGGSIRVPTVILGVKFLPTIQTDAGGFFGFGEYDGPQGNSFEGGLTELMPAHPAPAEQQALARRLLDPKSSPKLTTKFTKVTKDEGESRSGVLSIL